MPPHPKTVLNILKEEYNIPEKVHLPPLDELILTILSQNTSDGNRDTAWRKLKRRYDSWEEALDAPFEELVEVIRPAGLPNNKARAIKEALKKAKERFGEVSLNKLNRVSGEEAWRLLISIKGVGVKTAACVMIFSLSHPYFPVDTHIRRVSERLGWIPPGTGREKAQNILNDKIPQDMKYWGHLIMIEHGRHICRARKPLCDACPIRHLCPKIGAKK